MAVPSPCASPATAPATPWRWTYDPATEQLTYRSDKAHGPTVGTQALDPARVPRTAHHPHPPIAVR